MEIFGGFMIMAVLLGLLVLAIWVSLPILVFTLRTQVDKNTQLLRQIDERLSTLESKIPAGSKEP